MGYSQNYLSSHGRKKRALLFEVPIATHGSAPVNIKEQILVGQGQRKRKGRGREEDRKRKGRGKEEERKRKGRGKEEERRRREKKGSICGLGMSGTTFRSNGINWYCYSMYCWCITRARGLVNFASCMYTTLCNTTPDVDIMHN